MKALLLSISLLCLIGCTNPPYMGPDVVGAEDFVLDSYKIREGKFSILELEGKPFEEVTPELLKLEKDTVQNGDTIEIALYHPTRSDLISAVDHIGQAIGFTVRNNEIRLPDLSPISVKGMTLPEVQQKIQNAYAKEIDDVQVYVKYKKRSEKKVELAGLVSIPSFTVGSKTRLFEVLAQAKVPENANYFKSYVIRDDKALPVDMYRLMVGGDMSQNIAMRGGEKIFIASPASSTAMVLGEVNQKGVINLPSGYMPLRLVLAQAGGLTVTADRRYIQIIRGNIIQPKIYTVTWRHVVRLPTESLLVMPGDIVYVAATPIAEWNRFVNSILPTISSYELLANKVKGVILP